jgi:hypothetical protein
MSEQQSQRQGKNPTKEKTEPSPLHVSLDNADTVIEGGPDNPPYRGGSTYAD